MREQGGLPQWIFLDEAHDLLGADGEFRPMSEPTSGSDGIVNYRPADLCAEALSAVDVVPSVSPPTGRNRHQHHRNKYASRLMPAGRGFLFKPGFGEALPEARSIELFKDDVHKVEPDVLAWHLGRGDVSRWIADVVQDRYLATEVSALERDLIARQEAATEQVRVQIGAAIDARYPPDPARSS